MTYEGKLCANLCSPKANYSRRKRRLPAAHNDTLPVSITERAASLIALENKDATDAQENIVPSRPHVLFILRHPANRIYARYENLRSPVWTGTLAVQ